MMRNTQLKLYMILLLVFVAIFSVITASYAWFTISGRSKVDTLQINVTLGTGLEISLDKETWKQTLTNEDVANFYNSLDPENPLSGFRLMHVTTIDGKNFTTMLKAENYIFNVPNTGGFFTLNLFLRSSREFIIYLDDVFSVTGESFMFESRVDSGIKILANPAYAIRLAFESEAGIWVYEPNALLGNGGYGGANNAAVMYFNRMVMYIEGRDAPLLDPPLYEPPYNKIPFLGTKGVGITHLTKEDPKSPFFESELTVRIWMEGWDADCFDAIQNKTVSVNLAFDGLWVGRN